MAFDTTAGGAPRGGTSAAAPAALYQAYCSVCHGDHGDGQSRARASLNPPPTDFTQPAVRAALSRERMIVSVREGRPGTAMVGWKTQLADAQIATIVDFVRDRFMLSSAARITAGAFAPSPAPPGAGAASASASTPSSLPHKADKMAGAKLYAQNCVACHGKSGDGNGPRAYFIAPKPRSFITAESRAAFSRPILIHAIAQGKRGTEMPAWSTVLSDRQIADIAEFVFQQFVDATPATRARDGK